MHAVNLYLSLFSINIIMSTQMLTYRNLIFIKEKYVVLELHTNCCTNTFRCEILTLLFRTNVQCNHFARQEHPLFTPAVSG